MQQDNNMTGSGWMMRSAAYIGDLGSPFYREERQRDVWNEACAVGVQLMIWLGLAAAAAMIWIGGRPALPYMMLVLVLVGVVSGVTIGYAARLGVAADDGSQRSLARLVPYLGVVVVIVLGVVFRTGDDRPSWSAIAGAGVGAGVAALATTLMRRRARAGRDD